MYLNSDDDDSNKEPLDCKSTNFKYRESSPNPKKPFSPYLDIQELGTLTISNNFTNQTKYNYMPIIPSPTSCDSYNLDIPTTLPTTTMNTNEKNKLSSRPSTAICITPIYSNDLPFIVIPKTRPSSAIVFSKSTKQYQMVLSNLWVNSKFHKMYLEKNKKKEQLQYNNKNFSDKVVDENENKIEKEEDQIPPEEPFIDLLNASKKQANNENNELEYIEEDIQYESNDENKINILDDLEFNLTKKLNYFSDNDNNFNNTSNFLNSQSTETKMFSSNERITEENIYEDYSENYEIKNPELRDESEIPEIINTVNDTNNNDKLALGKYNK
jgi:hypothetical protein